METQEQEMLREAIQRIVGKFGHRYYAEKARAGEPTSELWDVLAGEGYLSVNLPEEYGGGGMGITELAIVCEELAAQGCPLLMPVLSSGMGGAIIARWGSEEQRRRWLPGIADGTVKLAFAITEPDAGSNSHRVSTTATRVGDEYLLRGTKVFISGVDESDAVLVVARTGTDEATGRGRLSLLVVDVDAPGFTRTEIPTVLFAPERQFTLFFDDVRLSPDRLIGTEGEGLRQVFTGLNPERICAAAVSTGIGRYALEHAAAYAKERQVWDVPIGAHQGIAHPLAEAKIDVELARLMTQKAAWLHDNGHDAGEASNIAKFAAAEAGLSALDQAIQTLGGNGLTCEFGIAEMWGLARFLRTGPVSREMILNFVAQHSLGLPKSY